MKKNIDFTEQIKEAFIFSIKKKEITNALNIYEKYKDKIDFVQLSNDNTNEIKTLFSHLIKKYDYCMFELADNDHIRDVEIAKQILNLFGSEIDFTKEIKEGFKNCLSNGYIEKALLIQKEFGTIN